MGHENIKSIFAKSSKMLIVSVLLMAGVALIASNSVEAVSNIPSNPPSRLVATPYSSTQINLSWSVPISNDSPPVTEYLIVYAIDNGAFQNLIYVGPTVTNFSHTNLMRNHIYTYEVFALNSVGTSNPSNVVTQMTVQDTTVPTPPTSVNAIVSSPTSIFLSWNLPQNNGGSPITGYKIEYSTTTVQWFVLTQNTGNAQQTFYHNGIDSSINYYYRVSAINSNGVGGPSNIASSVIILTTTPAVNGFAISPTQVSLLWVAPSNTYDQTISGYKIEQKVGTSYINKVDNTGLATSYTISGLTSDTTYTFRVSALFVGGTSSAPSTDVSVTPTSISYVPAPQQGNLPAGSSVYLSQPSPGNAYNVVFSNSGSQTQSFSSPTDQVNGIWVTASTFVNGAVLYFDSNGNTYSIAISSNSNTLISFSNSMSVSNVRMNIQYRGFSSDTGSVAYLYSNNPQYQPVPDAPQSLIASLNSQNNAQLSWIAPQNSGKPQILGFKVEYKTSSYDNWFLLNQNIGLSTIYIHSGLSPSSTYIYRVSAINSVGTSVPSNEASVITGSFNYPAPTFLQGSLGMTPVVNTDTSISYVISGGQIIGATVNKGTTSLGFQLQGNTAGVLYLQLPRTLIDAKQSDGSDRTFYVTINNKNVQFNETKTDSYRSLVIPFPANANQISIVGTSVVPEFPTVLIVLVIGLVSVILVSRRYGKLSFLGHKLP
ncbi:MAG TPA: fibronectin type III domain-containing protein [Nitrosopumilaceae archaeon]|nr:fibronectin type III domain-containing protein [Nitrosopumilaceae archaeon]